MNLSWLLNMAWRDSRKNRGRLILFISSIIIGIAALVAINSFSENLQKDIDSEAQSLLGADLQLESNIIMPDSIAEKLKATSKAQSMILDFPSMVLFPKTEDTRLSQIHGIEGDFPYYGKMVTNPVEAAQTFRNDGMKALVDKTMLLQFDIKVGDPIKIGELVFEIAGELISSPGSAGITSYAAPTVYIPARYLDATNLVQRGSRIGGYKYYYLFEEGFDIAAYEEELKPIVREAFSARTETVESRKEDLKVAFDNVGTFLNLVGFIALLLGCIGVASAVHIYVKDKISTVAILRCLGVSGKQAFLIFLLQIAAMGLIGSIVGALLGSGIQVLLPEVLKDFLPLQNVSSDVSWTAIIQGIVTGLSISVLFAMLPLLAIRKISPLRSLRASFEEDTAGIDPMRWVVYGLIFLFVTGFTYFQTGGGIESIAFPIGIGLGLLLLAGIAKLTVLAVRKFFPTSWSFIARQSIANLYRPNNQTLTLIVSIGLGTAFISTLFFVQDLLLQQIKVTGSDNQPNMILFNIKSENKDAIAELTRNNNLPVLQEVPIVTMNLHSVDGVSKSDLMQDTTKNKRKLSIYNREYRVTYRDHLIDTETVTEGEWGTENDLPDGTYGVSFSEWQAKRCGAELGSKIVWNVQGAMIETVLTCIRDVDFAKIQTNFHVLFPNGVLEKAPQFHALVSRAENKEQSAKFQKALIKAYPSVTALDLSQLLKSVDDILGKVSFVIRFMALFSILTGLLVLISSVVLSKYQRIQESVLLRTIGAKSSQILRINALEYFILGTLASMTGILIAFVGSFLLAKYTFKIPFTPDLLPPFLVFLSITILTVVIGLLNSREVLTKPPLEVLRRPRYSRFIRMYVFLEVCDYECTQSVVVVSLG